MENEKVISITAIKQNTINQRRLRAGLIQPMSEQVEEDVAPERAAQPIKSMDDINRISSYLKENQRWRDNMLFVVGINFGLRVSDLRKLRFCNLIDETMTFKTSFPVFEQKTRNTRKKKKNRYITINDAVIEAVTLYLENTPGVKLSDYLFRSHSNHGGALNEPLSARSVDRIITGIGMDLGLPIKMSTHTLRKTFAYWTMMNGGNSDRQLLLLQKMFNHSSPAQTLAYIGLDRDEMEAAYMSLNLGSTKRLVDSNIIVINSDDNIQSNAG